MAFWPRTPPETEINQMAGSRPINLEPSLTNPFLHSFFLRFLVDRNKRLCQGTTFHDSGRCLTLQGMPQITLIWCRPISGGNSDKKMKTKCFQAEQEVHRDLCYLALPGLHVHSPLPSSHRPKRADLCRGRLFVFVQESSIITA